MSRPVDADPQVTRQRILDAAVALLGSEGATLTTREVARRAQVSASTVHLHFGNNRGLLDACIDTIYYDGWREMASELQGLIASGERTEVIVERAVRTGFRYMRGHRHAARALERLVAEEGGLDRPRRVLAEEPVLAVAANVLGPRLSLSAREVRLRGKSIAIMVGRYSLMSDETARALAQVGAEQDPFAILEDHLAETAVRVLCAG